MAQMELSSSPRNYTHTYDVLLSFRGVDTRTGFTGHLYSALCQRGILTFMDDDALSKGEEITPSLLKAIQNSRIAIVIFSKNYANSTFCLHELVQILACHYTSKEITWIWPVFYDVDPSEVRHQTGSYAEAFAKYEQERFKDDQEKVKKWRLALHQAADLSGWHFKQGIEYEHVIIKRIVEKISCKINRPFLQIADYPVGLEARMRNVLSLMNAEFDTEVKMLGIHGMGGIGKSTLARAIYNLIAHQFENSCFLANVREKSSTRHGLVQIQETMLSELAREKNIKLGDVNQGIPILKERLHQKNVLLILDDVDKREQLQATAGGLDWFGLGSMVIITTRDKHLLDFHGVEKQYEIDVFNVTEALKLFQWNALRNKVVDPSCTEIIKRAIYYAGGLPLALETIGSNLLGKTLDQWKSALDAYEKFPNRRIQEILRVSYDGLEENEKEIFLDIACFFKGCTVKKVTDMLNACGFHADYGISVLRNKSLVNILMSGEHDGEFVTMHDLIQHMGKEIVRQRSNLPEKRNRLWFYQDIFSVLEKNMENDEIQAMLLDMPRDEEVQWNGEVFGKLNNLRMLIKKNGSFQSSPKHFPNSLRVLEWLEYPATSLPSNVASKNLVILNLSYSLFQWDTPLQKSKVLSQLIFTGCKNIREIPDVSGSPNLTELCVDDCINLIKIDDSVGFLDKLLRFSAKGCTKLRIVPHGIKLTSLEYLCLRDCSSLAIFPEILAPMEKLKFVDLEGTAIENLPLSLKNLKGLQSIHINRCRMLENNALSNIIQMLSSFFPFLKTLRLRNSKLTILPECIEECHFLELLDLCYCKQLQEIRGLPPNTNDFLAYNCKPLEAHSSTLNNLLTRAIDSNTRKFYVLPGESIPEWFDHSTKGNSLCFWFRGQFPSVTVCAILGVLDNTERPFFVNFNFFFKLNDIEIPFLFDFNYILDTDHMFMFNNFTHPMKLDSGGLVSENEWSYGEVLFVIPPNSGSSGSIKWSGVYVNRTCTEMENVRFSNPYPPNTTLPTNHGTKNKLDIQSSFISLYPRDWRGPFMYPEWKEPLDNVLSTNLRKIGQIDEISSEIEEAHLHNPYPSETMHDSHWSTCHENEVSRKLVDCRIKSSRSKPHFGTSSTVLPTKTEPSIRNQIEQTRDENEEMDTFYASLGAKSHVSHSRYKSATTALSKNAKEALKIVQDFMSDDALVLLHPERFSTVKNSLAYLSTLSAADGMSIAMEALVSEALGKFTHWRKDYAEASMKIETTASELQRADELEAGLESNKKQFMEVMALENELHQKLFWMEKRKENLEEEIKAIKANISASEIEKTMVHQRKRNIFEEGKTLQIQRDELMEKAPYFHQEHSLAIEKQTRIKAEWSEFREKFKKEAAKCYAPCVTRILRWLWWLLLLLLLLKLLQVQQLLRIIYGYSVKL